MLSHITPLLLSHLSSPERDLYKIYRSLSPSTPSVTLRALQRPENFCAQLGRVVEASPVAVAAACATLTQAALVASDVPGLVRALDEEHGLILAVIYVLPPTRLVYVFELGGKPLMECVHADEEVALGLVVDSKSNVSPVQAAARVVKESASAGTLVPWTPPSAGLVVARLAWINATAYAQPPSFFTHAVPWAIAAAAAQV